MRSDRHAYSMRIRTRRLALLCDEVTCRTLCDEVTCRTLCDEVTCRTAFTKTPLPPQGWNLSPWLESILRLAWDTRIPRLFQSSS
jgi:hypothetical protein